MPATQLLRMGFQVYSPQQERQMGHTGLTCGGRREQVGIEDGCSTRSVYTIIESFKIFLKCLKSDGLLIAYMLII